MLKYDPTVFENYAKSVEYKDNKFYLQLWDTAGQEDFDNIRSLSYPDSDIFIICFSLVDRTSFENVLQKWYSDLEENEVHKVPKILVGTKLDLKNDKKFIRDLKEKEGRSIVKSEEGENLAKKIGAFAYIETSAMKYKNVDEVFETCVKHIVDKKLKPKPKKKLKIFQSSSSEQDIDEDIKLFTK